MHKNDETTYQVVNRMNQFFSSEPQLNGNAYEVIVSLYKGSKLVQQDTILQVDNSGGTSKLIRYDQTFDNAKVSFKLLPFGSSNYNSPNNTRRYMGGLTYLNSGKNNTIVIEGTPFWGTF